MPTGARWTGRHRPNLTEFALLDDSLALLRGDFRLLHDTTRTDLRDLSATVIAALVGVIAFN